MPVEVEILWSPLARARLQEIHAYVALDNPPAAERLAKRILEAVENLRRYSRLGRAGARRGIRELVIAETPYIVSYKVRARRVTILMIWHGAQRNPS